MTAVPRGRSRRPAPPAKPGAPGRWGDGRRVRIGLLGGSFNPAHEGHRTIAETARKRLRLDAVWLLVSPGNPLKPARGMARLERRLASARDVVAGNARLIATDLEARLGTRFTIDTIQRLRTRFPRVRFVWLMGADNLIQIPRWQFWRSIFRRVPVAVFPRPGFTRAALASQAARLFRSRFVPPARAGALRFATAPAWTLLPMREHPASATAIRAGKAAVPRPRRRRAAVLQEAALDALVKRIVARLEDDKAEDVVVLDILGKAAFADRMVIASGLSGRQLKAMAEHLIDLLEADGLRVQAEGLGSSDWVLLDVGDVVIHLFRPEMRAHYALEKMWGVSLPGDEIRPGEVRRA